MFLYLTIAILITMSDQTSNWFKDYFLRLRPCHEESIKSLLRLVKSSCGGKYGFFSAHASNTFALSIFLINLFSKEIKLIYFLIIYSLFVAYSRIYLGVHFPLDVLFGIGIGFFYGFSISVVSKKLFFRFNNFRIWVYKFTHSRFWNCSNIWVIRVFFLKILMIIFCKIKNTKFLNFSYNWTVKNFFWF